MRRFERFIGMLAILSLFAPAARGQMSPEEAMRLLEEAEREADREAAEAEQAEQADTDRRQPEAADQARVKKEPVPFERMTPRMRIGFQREAGQYLKVGPKIIAIDGWLQQARIPRDARSRREPYMVEDAPLFYDPVADERYQSLSEIAPETDLKDLGLIYGAVADQEGPTALINTVHGFALIQNYPEDVKPDRYRRVLLVGRTEGQATLRTRDGEVKIPAVTAVSDGPVRRISGAELAEWVQATYIERFENWRPNPVWDERPKAKTVYDSAGRMGGGGVAVGRAEPREVITDRGEYHWQWIRGGKRIGPIIAMPQPEHDAADDATTESGKDVEPESSDDGTTDTGSNDIEGDNAPEPEAEETSPDREE